MQRRRGNFPYDFDTAYPDRRRPRVTQKLNFCGFALRPTSEKQSRRRPRPGNNQPQSGFGARYIPPSSKVKFKLGRYCVAGQFEKPSHRPEQGVPGVKAHLSD
jgi:hypothetical protein